MNIQHSGRFDRDEEFAQMRFDLIKVRELVKLVRHVQRLSNDVRTRTPELVRDAQRIEARLDAFLENLNP
jgi:hypothetical protein